MKDRTVMVGAAAVACLSLTTGIVFGGAVGAFGSGGPVVTPPTLVSNITVDSIAGIEPAAFYSSVTAPTIVIPPTPSWPVADATTAPRNQPLVVTATATSSSSATPTTSVTSTPEAAATTTTAPSSTPSPQATTSAAVTTTTSITTPVVTTAVVTTAVITTAEMPPVIEIATVLGG